MLARNTNAALLTLSIPLALGTPSGLEPRAATASPSLPEPAAAATAAAPAQSSALNILLIVLDDVGTDKLELYGQTPEAPPEMPYLRYPSTPNLDALALDSQGMFFRNYVSHPVCSPSRGSLMTGRYPFRTGLGSAINQPVGSGGPCPQPCEDQAPECYRMPDEEVFIPELLATSPHGYRSGAFGKWHMSYRSDDPTADACSSGMLVDGFESHAVDNGFDCFKGMMGNPITDEPQWIPSPGEDHFNSTWKVLHDATAPSPTIDILDDKWSAKDATDDAVAWINESEDPFFAYVAYSPPHTPFQLPPINMVSTEFKLLMLSEGLPYNRGAKAGLDQRKQVLYYQAMVEAVDYQIGRLLDGIGEERLGQTMIFVVADNGTPQPVVTTPHIKAHGKGSVYNFGVRVPLIVRGPLIPSAASSGLEDHANDEQVSVVDIWRTIGEIAEANESLLTFPTYPLDPTIDSQSFMPLLLDRSASGSRQNVFSQSFTHNGHYCGIVPSGQGSCFGSPPSANAPTFWDCDGSNGPTPAGPGYLKFHERAIADAQFKYVRSQTCSNYPTPACCPTQYIEELYATSDLEEVNNLLLGNPVPIQALQSLRAAMIGLSGY